MCSIMAGIGKLSSNRIKALLSLGEDRGTDSVGIAYMQNNQMQIAKIAERPCVAVNLSLSKSITESAISGLMIGHTRAATQGTVSTRNAHPFFDEGIAFAHNGIIFNDDEFGKYEVDSESLIHGIKAKDFSKYEGPIALVWIQDGKLKAYRCGNPLYRGRHNGSTYLASEADYLKSIGCTHVKQLSEGLIYTFDNAFALTTERVKKNQISISKYIGSSFTHDLTGSWGEDYINQKYSYPKKYGVPLPELDARHKEVRGLIVQEDFRTPRDIAMDMSTDGRIDHCDCCNEEGELTRGMCLACIAWLDENGMDKDNLPAWMRAY